MQLKFSQKNHLAYFLFKEERMLVLAARFITARIGMSVHVGVSRRVRLRLLFPGAPNKRNLIAHVHPWI